ncbi:hypothetical protein LTR36_001568 [Oleoguttula mirabilis]|uniref:Uncharacterized protein n=1 Tax=Oleoguttula mirabilis TaxID=1507867 RepID=A0AAV9JN69_9PEZI|nr:hypothetical protein LTR36_001568 [Oleoguttula mirabilis]
MSAHTSTNSDRSKSFLDLPPELRNQVYEDVAELECAGKRVKIDRRGRITVPQNVLGAVCRQTKEEYTAIYEDYLQQHVTSFVAHVEDFRLTPLESRLEQLFPTPPSAAPESKKRELVVYIAFDDACSEPFIEGLLHWLKACMSSELLAAFDRTYYVEFDWSCFEADDADWLQGSVQDQVQAHRGEEDYVRIMHAMVDAVGEQEGAQEVLRVKHRQKMRGSRGW